MSNFQLNDDDVVSMETTYAFTKTPTSQVSELQQAIARHLGDFRFWIQGGLVCRVLRASGGGWQTGKIYLRMEFIPDEPPEPKPSNPEPTDAVLSPKTGQ